METKIENIINDLRNINEKIEKNYSDIFNYDDKIICDADAIALMDDLHKARKRISSALLRLKEINKGN